MNIIIPADRVAEVLSTLEHFRADAEDGHLTNQRWDPEMSNWFKSHGETLDFLISQINNHP